MHGQQDPYLTHYMFNKMQFNPAYAGSNGMICVSGIYHNQWTGLEDQTIRYTSGGEDKSFNSGLGAKTSGVAINAPIHWGQKLSFGVGATILQDNIGYENSLKARGSFAARYRISRYSKISLGLDGGVLQKGIDGTKFIFRDPLDKNIPDTRVAASKPNFSAGLFYTNERLNDWYFGLSSTNLVNQRYSYSGGNFSNRTGRHYYLITGLTLDGFVNPFLEFKPSLLLKHGNTLQATLSGVAEYMQKFSGGLAYRTEADAASILLGYRMKNGMRVGYSYDLSLNALRNFHGGTHEIQINYCFMPKRVYEYILSPRHLNEEPKTLDVLLKRKRD